MNPFEEGKLAFLEGIHYREGPYKVVDPNKDTEWYLGWSRAAYLHGLNNQPPRISKSTLP